MASAGNKLRVRRVSIVVNQNIGGFSERLGLESHVPAVEKTSEATQQVSRHWCNDEKFMPRVSSGAHGEGIVKAVTRV